MDLFYLIRSEVYNMKKKKLGWLGFAPLLRFNLLIEFENDIKIFLSDGKKIRECVEDYYQNEPSLHLSRQNQISFPTKIVPGQGLNYSDKDGNNRTDYKSLQKRSF